MSTESVKRQTLLCNGYIRLKIYHLLYNKIPLEIILLIIKFYLIKINSNILINSKNTEKFLDILKKELNKNEQNMERIFCGSIDGFKHDSFITKCSNKSSSIMIIKSNFNNIFGIYLSESYKNDQSFYSDLNAFLFTIYPNRNVFKLKNKNDSNAFYCGGDENTIMVFGRNSHKAIDVCLMIYNDCNIRMDNFCCQCEYYNFNNAALLCGGDILKDNDAQFKIIELEVYSLS